MRFTKWLESQKELAKASFAGSFDDFVKMLQTRDMTDQQRKAAIKGKFPNTPEGDINRLY